MDPFNLPRVWTFGNGGGLYPRITVRALNYDDAFERACGALDKRYAKANKEPPVGWSLVLIGLKLRETK